MCTVWSIQGRLYKREDVEKKRAMLDNYYLTQAGKVVASLGSRKYDNLALEDEAWWRNDSLLKFFRTCQSTVFSVKFRNSTWQIAAAHVFFGYEVYRSMDKKKVRGRARC